MNIEISKIINPLINILGGLTVCTIIYMISMIYFTIKNNQKIQQIENKINFLIEQQQKVQR